VKIKAAHGLIFALFSLLTASCRTSPSVPKPEDFYTGRSGFALMADGAELYITADVQSARPILDNIVLGGLSGAEIKRFLDMSDILTAAVFHSAKRHFYAAAIGKFPSAAGGFFFSTSKDWEKRLSASGMPYWYSDQSRLSISLNSGAAYLSDTDPFVPPPGTRIPESLPALQKGAVLCGWMNNPSETFNRIIASFEVPIEIPADRLLFAVYPEGNSKTAQYTAALRFETPTPTQAAALARIFSLARMGLAGADFSGRENLKALAEALFSQDPKAEGNALILKTGTMKGRDLALLFNAILVS